MKRTFPVRAVDRAGRTFSALYITCGAPGCGRSDEHLNTNISKMNPDHAEKRWKRLGWAVGNNESRDRCPEHNSRNRKGTSMADRTVVPINHTSTEQSIPAQLQAAAEAAQRPPREQTRDDKRLIYELIEESYAGPEIGYREGWGDEKVALQLNVPRAWVETIRDEFFGPKIGPRHSSALDGRYVTLERRVDQIKSDVASLLLELNSLREDLRKNRAQGA